MNLYHQNPKIVENVRVTDKEIFESVDIFGVNKILIGNSFFLMTRVRAYFK
jgi:hypothetical protein